MQSNQYDFRHEEELMLMPDQMNYRTLQIRLRADSAPAIIDEDGKSVEVVVTEEIIT